MAEKFKNKYRNESIRLTGYDYGKPGLYFITICTANREHFFGKIINDKMQLSGIGVLADIFWHEIENHTKNVKLHQFVVMPDHIHGILEITQRGNCWDVACNVPTISTTTIGSPTNSTKSPTRTPTNMKFEINQTMSNISPKSGSLGRIIGSYKGAVTKHARRLGFEFNWQSRFYDHIIRNEFAFFNIAKYIENNPKNWKKKKLNKD